jgi:hypothetical protein
MTACVDPQGMSNTILQDKEIRKRQYIEAIDFYLSNTSLPIVFVENTNTNFSDLFSEYIDQGRLEYLTFDGNSSFDKTKGKGYGEALIMLYAINHSQLLQNSKYLIKVSGRIKVENIERMAKSTWLRFKHVWRSNIESIKCIQTIVFITEPTILNKILANHIEEISEIERGKNWIENIVANAICYDKSLNYVRIVPFTYSPRYDAFSGSSNKKYIIKDDFVNTADNIYECAKIEAIRNNIIKRYCFQLYYYVLMIYKRFLA